MTQSITWLSFCSRIVSKCRTRTHRPLNSDSDWLLIEHHTDHDSLPTHKFWRANLSLVLRSSKQQTPISNITIRNRATNKPDKAKGVMFVNILDSTGVVAFPWSKRGVTLGLAVIMIFFWPSLRRVLRWARVTLDFLFDSTSPNWYLSSWRFDWEVLNELICPFSMPTSLSSSLIADRSWLTNSVS